MSNSVQMSSESEIDFCLRVMCLRQKVLTLSREENCPFDETLVRKRFFHAIFTGLKHNSIRLELQNVLKAGVLSDEELLAEISVTASIELEHINKIKCKSSNQVSAVSHQEKNDSEIIENNKKKKENVLLAEINKLNAKVNELSSSVCNDIREVKEQLALGYNKESLPLKTEFDSRRRPRRIFRCQNCNRSNSSFCNHCFLCGASDHRKKDCQNSKN